MKRKFSFFIILISTLVLTAIFSVPTFAATNDQIIAEVTATHNKIIASNGGKDLAGYCAKYVSWSLYHRGITTKFEARGNGNNVFDNWKKISVTSGGYKVNAYSGSECLEAIMNKYKGETIENIVVGFQTTPYGDDGKKFGHVMFIHRITPDGNIYYSESGSWQRKSSGYVFVKNLSDFKKMYSGCIFDGAIHFTNRLEPANGTYCLVSIINNQYLGCPFGELRLSNSFSRLTITKKGSAYTIKDETGNHFGDSPYSCKVTPDRFYLVKNGNSDTLVIKNAISGDSLMNGMLFKLKKCHYLDVNAIVNGKSKGNTKGMCTFDVYINDIKVASKVNDYYCTVPEGAKYMVTNIKTTWNHKNTGASVYSGIVTSQNIVTLPFKKWL